MVAFWGGVCYFKFWFWIFMHFACSIFLMSYCFSSHVKHRLLTASAGLSPITLQRLPLCILIHTGKNIWIVGFDTEKWITGELKKKKLTMFITSYGERFSQEAMPVCWILCPVNVKCYCCPVEWNTLLKLFKICIYFWLAIVKLLLTAVRKTIKNYICFFFY